MGLYRAMVIHAHQSGLPRDRFVNTFHVEAPGPATAAEAEAVAEEVRDFYIQDVGATAENVSDQFGDAVAYGGHEVRMYPIDVATGANLLGDGEPPLWTEEFDHLGRGAGVPRTGYPSEVACCLSFKNTTDGGVPSRRRRGRIYLGPLKLSVGEEAAFQIPKILLGVRELFVDAAVELKTRLDAAGFTWVIYSRPYAGRDLGDELRSDGSPLPAIAARAGSTHEVNSFFVDDAFDIQRRRGEAAVLRTIG